MIQIDGSQGEGGGQILRTSLAMSLLTKTPIQIHKIRANRTPKPGLQPQHLACVRAAAEIGNAKLDGDRIGSSAIYFSPGEVVGGNYRFPIRTAGATSLVAHTVYLPLALSAGSDCKITIEGGTHVSHSPSFHFLEQTWANALGLAGLDIGIKMHRPGFYPRGGGEIEAHVKPTKQIKPLRLTTVVRRRYARVVAGIAGLNSDIGKRLARKASQLLEEQGLETESTVEEWSGGPSCVLMITLPDGPIPILVCGMGQRGKPAEVVASETVAELIPLLISATPSDGHTADQLLLPLAFAEGESVYNVSEVTGHLTTNAQVIGMFGKATIDIDGEEGSPGTVRVSPNRL